MSVVEIEAPLGPQPIIRCHRPECGDLADRLKPGHQWEFTMALQAFPHVSRFAWCAFPRPRRLSSAEPHDAYGHRTPPIRFHPASRIGYARVVERDLRRGCQNFKHIARSRVARHAHGPCDKFSGTAPSSNHHRDAAPSSHLAVERHPRSPGARSRLALPRRGATPLLHGFLHSTLSGHTS